MNSIIISTILGGLSILVGSDVSNEASDIVTAVGSPTEANLDKCATDLRALLTKRTKLSPADIDAIITTIIAGIGAVEAPSVATIGTAIGALVIGGLTLYNDEHPTAPIKVTADEITNAIQPLVVLLQSAGLK